MPRGEQRDCECARLTSHCSTCKCCCWSESRKFGLSTTEAIVRSNLTPAYQAVQGEKHWLHVLEKVGDKLTLWLHENAFLMWRWGHRPWHKHQRWQQSKDTLPLYAGICGLWSRKSAAKRCLISMSCATWAAEAKAGSHFLHTKSSGAQLPPTKKTPTVTEALSWTSEAQYGLRNFK